MSSSPLPAPERDNQLLSVGQQCSESTCNLVDFLPFKCQHCNQPYCGDHFLPLAHKCDKYDESKYNRVAPECPLCNTPVAVPPGQDPNVRMEQHISMECSVMTGKIKASSTPRCGRPKCGKILFSPIVCTDCKQQFCPTHRFPKDHTCIPRSQPAAIPKAKPTQSASALAAFKRAVNTPQIGEPSQRRAPVSPVKSKAPKSPVGAVRSESATTSLTKPNLFSKTDRRAKAERESRLKAMQARASKGLLSEEEKVIFAAEKAEAARHKDGCIIV